MESQKQLIMDTWLIMNIHGSIVGMHNAVMDIRNLKFTIMSIIQSWLSIIPTFGIRARVALSCIRGKNAAGYGCYASAVQAGPHTQNYGILHWI